MPTRATATLLLLLAGPSHADGGPAPSSTSAEQRGWLDSWRQATVAIGEPKEVALPVGSVAKSQLHFSIVGTGVLLGLPDDPKHVPWLVTAKHVVTDPTQDPQREHLLLRFAWHEDKPIDYLGVTVPLRRGATPLWTAHPDAAVELVAIPLSIKKADAGRDTVVGIPLANFASESDVFDGASILVLGYPSVVGEQFWARALTRSGVVAWTNPTDPVGSPLLIDAAVLPGNSGSPVFAVPTGLTKSGGFQLGGRAAFLGIAVAARVDYAPLFAGGKPVRAPPGSPVVQARAWADIGVVEPATRVLQLLKVAASRNE